MTGPLHEGRPGFLRCDSRYQVGTDKRDILVCQYEVEQDYFLQIKPLYHAMHEDLAREDWQDPISGDDTFEGLYWERFGHTGLKEHNIWWRMVKVPPHKSDFVRYALKIDFQSLAGKPAEIPYKGKKAKVEKTDLIIRVWAWVQWDYQDKFRKSFVKGMEQTFKRQLYRDELQWHIDEVNRIAQDLRAFIKDYFQMEEMGERPRQFHPEGGYRDQFVK